MSVPVSITPAKRRRRRKRRAVVSSSPAPVALTLLEATYDPATTIRLKFDRAIDVSGLVGTAIVINDGEFTNETYRATGAASMIDPQTVEIAVEGVVGFPGSDTRLTASAASGIVAVDDGGTWAGVSGLLLPFP